MLRLERFFDIPIWGKVFKKYVLQKEGGLKESKTIRRYFAQKHNCYVDLYSYGGCFDAKQIKFRFDRETIDLLEASQWWELPPKDLFRFYDLRKDPKAFAQGIVEYKNTVSKEK